MLLTMILTIEVGGCRNAKEEISTIHVVTYSIWQHQRKLVEPTEKLPMVKDWTMWTRK